MKKEFPHQKGDQKSRRNDVDIQARRAKRKSVGDIHLHHHYQSHLMASHLLRVNVETMRARKTQILDLD